MGGTLNVTATSLEVTGSIYTFHEEEKTSDEKTSRILDWSVQFNITLSQCNGNVELRKN